MNNIQFTGTVFKPELRYTPDAKPVFRFSVSLYTGKKGDVYNPSVFIRVTAFGELAEHLNQTLAEKQRVTVKGAMQPVSEWTDKEGNVRRDWQVIANEVVQGDTFQPDAQHPGKAEAF